MTAPSKVSSPRIRGVLKRPTTITGHPVTGRAIVPDNQISRETYDKAIGDRLSEDAWREQYRRMAADLGFSRQYHTRFSEGSERGFPDDVMINRRSARMLYIEGKRESGQLTFEQVAWLDDLAGLRDSTGYPEVYVARPSDRLQLWETLAWQAMPGSAGTLHQWCLDLGCQRCTADRARSLPYRPRTQRRRHGKKV